MRSRAIWIVAILTVFLAAAAAGCGGGDTDTSGTGGEATGKQGGEIQKGGIVRIGSTDQIDSLNPFVAFNAQSYIAFVMTYPILVQYDENLEFEGDWAESWETSDDGVVWTFKLKPGEWSDGQPLTAEDAAWTGTTILKYKDGAAASLAPFLSHVKTLEAPDENTLVITYEQPVGNVLPQLQQFFILPKHVWEPRIGDKGKGLKTFKVESELPVVGGGAFFISEFDKKGTTIYEKNPGYYDGPETPYVDAVGLQFFTNEDAMFAAFKAGELDVIDEVPLKAVESLKQDDRFVVESTPGAQVNNFIFNSNPKKPDNRELLDPKVREAIAHAIDREEIAETVYAGLAKPVASIVAQVSGDWMNPDLEPEAFDIDLANQILDDAGYERGSDGIRLDEEGEKMAYEVITPTGVQGINRAFEIVRNGVDQIGIKLTQKALDDTTAFEEIGAPDYTYLEFDLSMWNWVGYYDPDFVLSVVGCDQYGGWSDTAYCNPDYDKLYKQQGVTIDQAERREIVYEMQKILYDDRPYIQLVNLDFVWAVSKSWDGYEGKLSGYSKAPYTEVHRVG
ncbi:MAG: ABC transporter substrate-binding protein [Gaiellaceae bacterium]